jgi:hypothetical protein
MSLATLPDGALHLLLCYVGDAVTLLNVEKTCRRLKTAVEDDTVWAAPSRIVMNSKRVKLESDAWDDDTRLRSNRERACVSKNLQAVYAEQWQPGSSNILLEELGTLRYTAMAHLLLGYNAEDVIRLREDTLETLAELVQYGILLQLQRSLKIVALAGEGSTSYPTVTVTSIKQQAELANMLECLPSGQDRIYGRLSSTYRGNRLRTESDQRETTNMNGEMLNLGIDTRRRDRVIRRLAYRAGVPKMSSPAYNFVWEMIYHLTEEILYPACSQLISTQPFRKTWEPGMAKANMAVEESVNIHEKIKVQSWRMTRYVPPNVEVLKDRHNWIRGAVWTPVPGQLEETSARLGLAARVYSVLGDPSSIATVQENYEVTEDIGDIEYEIEYESEEHVSSFVDYFCEDDDESDFSIYSDATEEDMMSTTSGDLDEEVYRD